MVPVLRSLFVVTAFLGLLSACGKKEPEAMKGLSIVGSWRVEATGSVYHFAEDGKFMIDNGASVGSYTFDGTTLTLTYSTVGRTSVYLLETSSEQELVFTFNSRANTLKLIKLN